MVTVTDRAKEELKRTLERTRLAPGKYLRLAMAPIWEGDGDFGIVIDGVGDGDYVVDFQGWTVLRVDALLAEHLSNAELDFKDSPGGPRFTLDVF